MVPRPVLRCTFCHDDLRRHDAVFCAGCLAPHHAGCRREHGRCAAPGCVEQALVRPHLAAARAAAGRGRSSAVLAGMSGVALGVAVVAAGLGVGELLPVHELVKAPVCAAVLEPSPCAADRPALKVFLGAHDFTHTIFLCPGERLVFLGGPLTGIEVKRLDSNGVATSVLIVSPTTGIDVSVASQPGSTWVPAAACPVVLGFDGTAVIGGTPRPARE